METGGGSESHPPVKKEDTPVPVGSSIPTPEKGEEGLISSRRPTPQGQRGGEAEGLEGDKERREDGAFTRAPTQKEVAVAVELGNPSMDEVEDEVTLAAGDIPAPMEKEEAPFVEGSKSLTPEALEEMVENYFKCPSCRSILDKPVVIACGHMFCASCYEHTMNVIENSKCFVCMNIYNYLPRPCQLIHDLITKLQLREEREETETETFSLMAGTVEGETVMEPNAYQCAVQVKDVSCLLCNGLLYQPAVLNCGHVFCISCIPVGGEKIECPICTTCHPSGDVSVCINLDDFIQYIFPSAYKFRIKNSEPFAGNTPKSEIVNSSAKLSQTHIGVGCDFCGVYPIKGDRYTCKTCKEFDLCGKCAKIGCPVEGRSGQLHLPDHVLELDNSFLLANVLRVVDNQEDMDQDDNEGTYEFRPAGWVFEGGMMRWDAGQQAPEDDDGAW